MLVLVSSKVVLPLSPVPSVAERQSFHKQFLNTLTPMLSFTLVAVSAVTRWLKYWWSSQSWQWPLMVATNPSWDVPHSLPTPPTCLWLLVRPPFIPVLHFRSTSVIRASTWLWWLTPLLAGPKHWEKFLVVWLKCLQKVVILPTWVHVLPPSTSVLVRFAAWDHPKELAQVLFML